jgi:hypothetical protein
LEKKYNKKGSRTKEIIIKRIGTKFDIKIIWNHMLRMKLKKNKFRKVLKKPNDEGQNWTEKSIKKYIKKTNNNQKNKN